MRIMGGTRYNTQETVSEYLVVDQRDVKTVPGYLDNVKVATLPVTGLTAWRALMRKAGERNCGSGSQIVITGSAGAVALMALLFAVKRGVRV